MESTARYDLGVSSAEFWDMTPREFGAMLERRKHHKDEADFRAGLLASVIINSNPYRKSGSRPVQPQDFFPNLAGKAGGRKYISSAQAQGILANFAAIAKD